jgi:hypothetical protein
MFKIYRKFNLLMLNKREIKKNLHHKLYLKINGLIKLKNKINMLKVMNK